MFRLHDTSRRRICLGLFAALCIAPTALVLGWAWWLSRPAYVEQFQGELSSQLGLPVKLSGVTHPMPQTALVEGFEIADPETNHTLFFARLLEIKQHQGTWHIKASQPEMDLEATSQLFGWLEDALRYHQQQTRVVLRCGEITLHAGRESQTFTGVEGWFEPLPGGAKAGATFHLAGASGQQPTELHIVRSRTMSPPATRVELKTGPTPIPVGILSANGRAADWLGGAATFQGELFWTIHSDSWEADLDGHLHAVDLHRLVANRFPHQLSGPAQLTLHRARVREGRLEEAVGRVHAGPGSVSGSLLRSLSKELNMPPPEAFPPPRQLVGYDRLAFTFEMAAGELSITGQCPDHAGAVMVDRHGPLLREPPSVQTVVSLVRALVPQSQVLVPAARETDWLLGRLPIPRLVPPADADTSARRVHVGGGSP